MAHYLYADTWNTVPLQVAIVKLKMDKDRKNILDRRAKGRAEVGVTSSFLALFLGILSLP